MSSDFSKHFSGGTVEFEAWKSWILALVVRSSICAHPRNTSNSLKDKEPWKLALSAGGPVG